jgi:CRP-like cAMP-binding protein
LAQERATVREGGKPRNHFLANLPAKEFERIAGNLVAIELPQGMLLSEPDEPIGYLYFPEHGLISTNATTPAGESIEVGMIGREGFSGVAALLGQPEMQHTVVVQTPGSGYRLRASVMLEELQQSSKIRAMVDNFLYVQMVTATQSVLCARLHSLQQRLARWLLTAADRSETERLDLTQEYMARMLGSRRSTVTVTAQALQEQGMIEYKRGRVTIVNRPKFETAACECYGIVKASHQKLLSNERAK